MQQKSESFVRKSQLRDKLLSEQTFCRQLKKNIVDYYNSLCDVLHLIVNIELLFVEKNVQLTAIGRTRNEVFFIGFLRLILEEFAVISCIRSCLAPCEIRTCLGIPAQYLTLLHNLGII